MIDEWLFRPYNTCRYVFYKVDNIELHDRYSRGSRVFFKTHNRVVCKNEWITWSECRRSVKININWLLLVSVNIVFYFDFVPEFFHSRAISYWLSSFWYKNDQSWRNKSTKKIRNRNLLTNYSKIERCKFSGIVITILENSWPTTISMLSSLLLVIGKVKQIFHFS